MNKLDLQNTKKVVNEIITLNQQYSKLNTQLKKLQKEYKYGLSFTKDTFNIFNFIDHLTIPNNAAEIKKEILSNNYLLLNHFNY